MLYIEEECAAIIFLRRFVIALDIYKRIRSDLLEYNSQTRERRGLGFRKFGIPTDNRIIAGLRKLITRMEMDKMDQMFGLIMNTAEKYFIKFCADICEIYGDHFLNKPTTMAELKDIINSTPKLDSWRKQNEYNA